MFGIPLQDNISLKRKKEIQCYNEADYKEICEQLKAVHWQSLVEGTQEVFVLCSYFDI